MCDVCGDENHLSESEDRKVEERRSFLKKLGLMATAIVLPGCATTPPPPVRPQLPPTYHSPLSAAQPRTLTHTIAQGETVWRVSKMYGVEVDEIIRLNNIYDVRDISIGTKLTIPTSLSPMPVYTFDQVPFYPDRGKWKYIIIHHTATDIGNAESIDRAHRMRGYHSLGYHFLIGNGSQNGQRVGLIEPGPRWFNQEDGAHCKAGDMNRRAIGVSIVGNFSETNYVDPRQLESMAFLTRNLMHYYHIPRSNIMGHGQVPGAHTECPGKLFPMQRFMDAVGY